MDKVPQTAYSTVAQTSDNCGFFCLAMVEYLWRRTQAERLSALSGGGFEDQTLDLHLSAEGGSREALGGKGGVSHGSGRSAQEGFDNAKVLAKQA